MTAQREPMEELEPSECWALLGSANVGRLAVDIAGHPDIFPINFVVDEHHDHGRSIVFRTAPGTKFAGAVLGLSVAFEIDGYEPERGVAWSVVVKGKAREIDRMYDYVAAQDLPLFPWHASPKPDFVRIEPELVTGRRFTVVDRESS
jgi:nitroimidazol reductase NimA-like FMN-containing flavoprotein (pyridoxamine 5'-phosphate oxidase superfamily)